MNNPDFLDNNISLKGKVPSEHPEVKVSVIIICYNQEHTIARAIESVLAQKTDFPFEIIIGEDCSTDNTAKICKEFAKRYPEKIRLLSNTVNKGLLHNYYDCVLSATGEYVADLGGDDFWIDPLKLQIEADILDRYPDVSLVHTDWDYYDENKRAFFSPWIDGHYPYLDNFAMEYPPLFLLKHLNPAPVHLCSAMYRNNLFRQLYNDDEWLFRNKEFIVEDLQLTVMLATLGRFIYIDRKTLAYSFNEQSLTGTRDSGRQFDLYLASMNLTRYLEEKIGADHKELVPVYQEFSHFLLMQAFHARDNKRMERLRKNLPAWDIKPYLKTSVIIALSKSSVLWLISLRTWKMYRKLKPRKNKT